MKTKIFGLFALMCALVLTSCSSELRRRCPDAYAPDSLAGKKMQFEYSHATGSFSNLKKQTSYAKFDTGSMTFEMTTEAGAVYNSGFYSYLTMGPDNAELILMTNKGPQHNQLRLKLKFSGVDEGKFSGELKQGAVGNQRGKFEITSD